MPDRPVCFVIAPIGKEKTDVRQRSDQILRYLITPVAESFGYDTVRADKISEVGLITTQVINHIVNDAMVVADLTGSNPNVFYELAVRHATGKPYVQLIQQGETIPFDVAGIRTIQIDHTNLDSVDSAKEEIRRQMALMKHATTKIESPISSAIDFDKLHRSDDPTKRQMADILEEIGSLRAVIVRRLPDLKSKIIQSAVRRQQENEAMREKDSLGTVNNAKVTEILEQLKQSLAASKNQIPDPPAEEDDGEDKSTW